MTRLAALLLLLSSLPLYAQTIDLSTDIKSTLGKYALLLQEQDKPLTMAEARKAYAKGDFIPSRSSYLNFGIDANPVWLRFEIVNKSQKPILRRLLVETSWLDHIDVYFRADGGLQQEHLGDAQAYSKRPIDNRFFTVEHRFNPGLTSLYIRVATPDPMVLPIFLLSVNSMHAMQMQESYGYGFLYGAIGALIFYNLMLFFGLKSSRHLFYSIYLLSFVAMNIAYTGHGFRWLWPEAVTWQLWSNPVLMIAYAVSGLLFATRFLDTHKSFPRLHRGVMAISIGIVAALVLAIYINSQVMALLLAFSFVLLYTVAMVLLGAVALYAGNQSAKYFLYASIIAAVGATITALTVWGITSYSPYAYHAVEFGTVIEAVLLALALADMYRRNQADKIRAEQMARLDPLTGLNNRRSFYELVEPLWRTGLRKEHDMALMILDLDGFKSINDSYGHVQGDKVLEGTARVLKRSARAGDVVARWGGEEFILFMPETPLKDAVKIAERVRENIAALRIEANGKTLTVTGSFGVADCGKQIDTLDSLILLADKHLYKAKELGRNRVSAPMLS